MRKIGVLLIVVVLGLSALPRSVAASDDDSRFVGLTEALRALLEKLENGVVSEEELGALLAAEAGTISEPANPNLSEPQRAGEDSRVDESEERALLPTAPVAADGSIMVNGVPVATLASPLVISAAAFSSDGRTPNSSLFVFAGGYLQGSPPGDGCVRAPAFLPSDVTVSRLFASVWDNDPSLGITVTLQRVENFGAGAVETMASASTTAPSASTSVQPVSDDTINEPAVLYPDYSYYLTTCLGSADTRLYSVRLYFSP